MSRPFHCKMCHRAVKRVSSQHLCAACSIRKVKINVRQLRKKKGKYYKSWKLNLLEAIKKQPM